MQVAVAGSIAGFSFATATNRTEALQDLLLAEAVGPHWHRIASNSYRIRRKRQHGSVMHGGYLHDKPNLEGKPRLYRLTRNPG